MTIEELIPGARAGHTASLETLIVRARELERDLAESRKATEAVQAYAEIDRTAARLQLADAKAREQLAVNLAQESREQLRREAARVLAVAKSLRGLFDILTADPRMCLSDQWQEERAKRVRDAEEILALVEVPFG